MSIHGFAHRLSVTDQGLREQLLMNTIEHNTLESCSSLKQSQQITINCKTIAILNYQFVPDTCTGSSINNSLYDKLVW